MPQHFSSIELFYSENYSEGDAVITLGGGEYLHLIKVMRHHPGDRIYLTDGRGSFITSVFETASKNEAKLKVESVTRHNNKFKNFTFLIPVLKSSDRLEFALEKAVELGFTNFIFFKADKSVKPGVNLKRLDSIALSAMKQSIRFYIPVLSYSAELNSGIFAGKKVVILDQESSQNFDHLHDLTGECYFLFGPEGGLSSRELNLISDAVKINLSEHRLRAETAVISAASVLSQKL